MVRDSKVEEETKWKKRAVLITILVLSGIAISVFRHSKQPQLIIHGIDVKRWDVIVHAEIVNDRPYYDWFSPDEPAPLEGVGMLRASDHHSYRLDIRERRDERRVDSYRFHQSMQVLEGWDGGSVKFHASYDTPMRLPLSIRKLHAELGQPQLLEKLLVMCFGPKHRTVRSKAIRIPSYPG